MLRSAAWSGSLALAGLAWLAGGCGDDRGAAAPPVTLHPVPGCEAIDPAPCDVFVTTCQTRLLELAACMRGSSPGALPPVSRMTEAEYAQWLTARMAEQPPPPNLNHYEAGLVMLGLVARGAFAPSSMAATRAAFVWGVYRHDTDDIVLIDRGLPGDDVDVNSVMLHELVHALQDRDQDLTAWYDAHAGTYDEALAAMSVVEGEARLHQQRYGASALGLDPNAINWPAHFENTVAIVDEWVRAQPSPYLASYSGFPYEYGARLLLPRFFERGHQAIAELFASPPTDTRLLLDPRAAANVPAGPMLMAPVPPADWVLTQETTLGAWGTYLELARNGSIDARLLALGWRGDRLWVYGGIGAAEEATTVVWRIAFADDATAASVAQLLRIRLNVQQAGAEIVIAMTNSIIPVDWTAAATAARDTSNLSIDNWISRAMGRDRSSSMRW
jgi:hypothetical protein